MRPHLVQSWDIPSMWNLSCLYRFLFSKNYLAHWAPHSFFYAQSHELSQQNMLKWGYLRLETFCQTIKLLRLCSNSSLLDVIAVKCCFKPRIVKPSTWKGFTRKRPLPSSYRLGDILVFYNVHFPLVIFLGSIQTQKSRHTRRKGGSDQSGGTACAWPVSLLK